MKKTKSILCLILALLLVLSMTACGAGGTEEKKDDGKKADAAKDGGSASADDKITLRIGMTGHLGVFLEGLSPMECHSACDAIYDSIFRIDPFTFQVKSDVLEDWHWEGNYFVMKMYDGIYFNTGVKADSEDLFYSYKNHEDRGSSYLTSMELDFDKTEIRDELTVAFYCNIPNRAIEETTMHLYSKDFADEVGSYDSEKWFYPACSGPYEVVDYAYDDHITLKLRDNYWKRSVDDYYVGTYELTYYTDAASLYMELELGNIDFCEILQSDYARYMSEDNSNKHYNVCLDSTGACFFVNFGFRDNDIWYNKDLRTAIAYAVNWPELGQLITTDLYKASNSFVPTDSPSYYDAGTWEYNPEKAVEYLEKAGYGPGELTVKGTCMDTPKYKAFGQGMTYYLNNVGINVDFQYADVSAAIANWLTPGNNDLMFKYNSGGSTQHNLYQSCNESSWETGVSWTYIDDAHYQELFDILEDPSVDYDTKIQTEKDMQKYMFDEVLALPVCEYAMAFGYNSDILTPEVIAPITFGVSYQLKDMGLKSTWGK